MKVVSFNVNGIRARFHQLEALIKEQDPEIIGLQEIKVQDDDFPLEAIETMGYHVEYFGQKSHYGVGIMSKTAPVEVIKGMSTDQKEGISAQRRLITGRYCFNGTDFIVINGYFPQGESQDHETKYPGKKKFYADLLTVLNKQYKPNDNLIVMGDVNVAQLDLDIGIGADNAKRWLRTGKCSFLPEEREWLQKINDWGLVDSFRQLYPDEDALFSWFDYRSKGFDREPKRGLRIDQILLSSSLSEKLLGAGVSYKIRATEKPSDHCPIWAELDL